MRKYKIVTCGDDDKIFVAEASELPGRAAHGKTQAEALGNINEVVKLWLESAREFSDEVLDPQQHRLAA